MLSSFLDAVSTGNLGALTDLLSEDVTAWNDGGGKVRAAPRAVIGRHRVMSFVAGLLPQYELGWIRLIEVNGGPAIRLSVNGMEQIVTAEIRDGRIHALFAILNPDKLQHAR